MIYTVTFNPAIDYVMHAPVLVAGETNRSSVLTELGVPNTALGFAAGFTGAALCSYLEAHGIRHELIALKQGLTRINIKIKSELETELNAEGPEIPPEALDTFFAKLDRLVSGDILVLAGSVPRSVCRNIYEKIAESVTDRGVRLVIDAEGELLLNVLKYRPLLIKPNYRELCALAEKELTDETEIAEAAKHLQALGAENVLVSLGSGGARLLGGDGTLLRMPAAKVQAVNTVGAGDSMVAGFLAGIGHGYEYALKLGIAAGGATAAATGLADGETIFALLKTLS